MKNRIYLILRIVFPIIGIIIGTVKIIGIGIEVHVFESFGVPDWFRIVFGIIQAVGAIFLIISSLETIGIIVSVTLFVIVTGLMAYHHMFSVLAAPIIGMAFLVVYTFLRIEYHKSVSSSR